VKQRLRELLDARDLDGIADVAQGRRRTLGILVSLTFDADPVIVWRAIEAIGAAADRIAETSPDYVRSHLRRLHWLISDESGAVCWHAPEAMAEIVCRRPALYSDYVPIVASLLRTMAEEDLVGFRAGILWAVGRLGDLARDHVHEIVPAIEKSLADPDPQVRGMAVWCLQRCGRAEILQDHHELETDDSPVLLYQDGELIRRRVRELVRGP
jgi:HEAT repeat protein